MKKPALEGYTDEVLIQLSKQELGMKMNSEIKEILLKRFISYDLSYLQIYNKYKKSVGILKDIYGNLLAKKVIDNMCYVDEETLSEILPSLSIDSVWSLSKHDDSSISKKASQHLFLILDSFDKKEDNVIENKNIVYFKRKGDKK